MNAPPTPGSQWARWSLVYLAGYLSVTGAAFLVDPTTALRLLAAQRTYSDAFVQFAGALMIAIAALVVQMIRLRLVALYRTTAGIRIFLLAAIGYLYVATRDRLFLVILGVVSLGVALTLLGLVMDARRTELTVGS